MPPQDDQTTTPVPGSQPVTPPAEEPTAPIWTPTPAEPTGMPEEPAAPATPAGMPGEPTEETPPVADQPVV